MKLNNQDRTTIIELKSKKILILSTDYNGVYWVYRKINNEWDKVQFPDVINTINDLNIIEKFIPAQDWFQKANLDDLVQLSLLNLKYSDINIDEWVDNASLDTIEKIQKWYDIVTEIKNNQTNSKNIDNNEYSIEINCKYFDSNTDKRNIVISAISQLLNYTNVEHFSFHHITIPKN